MDNKEYLDLSVHEIKNILSAISGYSEFISNRMVNGDKVLEFAEKIRGLSDVLAGYADKKYMYDLLHNHLYKAELEFVPVYEQLEKVRGKMAEHEPLDFLISCEPDIKIYADRLLMEELFNVLMENAVRYSPDGETAEIFVARQGNETVVSIKNASEEITGEEIARLTEPYYRIDKAASRKMGGQGFGLAIASEIMKLHDGEIIIAYENGYTIVELHFHFDEKERKKESICTERL